MRTQPGPPLDRTQLLREPSNRRMQKEVLQVSKNLNSQSKQIKKQSNSTNVALQKLHKLSKVAHGGLRALQVVLGQIRL